LQLQEHLEQICPCTVDNGSCATDPSALAVFLGDFAPYIALLPAVAFAAMYCGLGPSMVSAILGLLAAKFWFIPVTHSLTIDQSQVMACLNSCSLPR